MNRSLLTQLFSRKMLLMLFFGFSSGLPLLATGSTLQAWMKDEGVNLTTIGLFALVGLPYTVKFLWSPLFDRFQISKLGRRRGWILCTQGCLLISFWILSTTTPSSNPSIVALLAFLLCFFSASQDIVIDAYRRDLLDDDELALGSSVFIGGYRLGLVASGAAALGLADHFTWHAVYIYIGACMAIGMGTTLLAPEPLSNGTAPNTLRDAVVEPLRDYFLRPQALYLLLFILLYKVGDQMASSMWVPFSQEHGYSKTDIALVGKTFGLVSMIVGGILGGAILLRINMIRGLFLFGILQATATLGFCLLSLFPPSLYLFGFVLGFEHLASGMGTAAFTAFIAHLCNRRFSATQYALLSSLLGIPRTILSAPTGWLASQVGWTYFFLICVIAAFPAIFMISNICEENQGTKAQG